MSSTLERIFWFSFLIGWALISTSVIVNVRVVEILFVADNNLEWPNTFYVHLVRIIVLIAGFLLLLLYVVRHRIYNYFVNLSLKESALHLLIALIVVDLFLQVSFLLTANYLNNTDLRLIYQLFHLDWEKNIPSAYSALQLIAAGCVALYSMRVDTQLYIGKLPIWCIWLVVGIILFYLAIDEWFSLHENAGVLVKQVFPYGNPLGRYGHTWTIAGGVFALIVSVPAILVFSKIFLQHRYLFYILMLSGFIFLLGAIGMENFQLYIRTHQVNIEPTYFLMLEEFFEMLAVSLVVFVFVRYCGEAKFSREHNA